MEPLGNPGRFTPAKGEIRPNTALKSEAARLGCEKMSGAKYGR